MLLRLLFQFLRPYTRDLAAVIALQTASTAAMVYLPSLYARIIDQGVAVGDTGYILSARRGHARADRGPGRCARSPRCTSARARRWRSAAICAPRSSIASESCPPHEVGMLGAPSLITRTTNDVQQVQMLVLMGVHDAGARRRSCASAAW